MTEADLLHLAASALRQSRKASAVGRGIHIGVCRDAVERARHELARIETELHAEESQLAIDQGGAT